MTESKVCINCAYCVAPNMPRGANYSQNVLRCKKMAHIITGKPALCVEVRFGDYEVKPHDFIHSSDCGYEDREYNVCGRDGLWFAPKENDND